MLGHVTTSRWSGHAWTISGSGVLTKSSSCRKRKISFGSCGRCGVRCQSPFKKCVVTGMDKLFVNVCKGKSRCSSRRRTVTQLSACWTCVSDFSARCKLRSSVYGKRTACRPIWCIPPIADGKLIRSVCFSISCMFLSLLILPMFDHRLRPWYEISIVVYRTCLLVCIR